MTERVVLRPLERADVPAVWVDGAHDAVVFSLVREDAVDRASRGDGRRALEGSGK